MSKGLAILTSRDDSAGMNPAVKCSIAAVDALEAGQTNSIMIYRDGVYGHLPIHEVADAKYVLDPALLSLATPLAC